VNNFQLFRDGSIVAEPKRSFTHFNKTRRTLSELLECELTTEKELQAV